MNSHKSEAVRDEGMSDRDRPRVRGVVLAGGRSTRFGDADKALATFEGRPLVVRAVDAVAAATEGPPLLSVATDAQAERLGDVLGDRPVEPVRDDPSLSGPLAGLSAAVAATGAPWLFACACDMPLVSPESVEALRARITESGAPAPGDTRGERVDAVVPVVDGCDQPLHALYRRAALDDALGDLAAGDALMGLLDELSVERVAADAVDAPLAEATTNVNTRGDLAALRERDPRE
ncbi:molybdenum cofactor guanylyltransferase [Halosimplex rubrum]|uniref:Probable molybdenum cofactor guanylyltransferase n=1 Tax=Halosimplex rubrum TaxID=869889 RepID=A0A7D5P441_9EURY|nr:molybdenum cofactor guanylyltransferase [Halosimplex rubrum]QLH77744.1 molybdenum cofactor guanylyltransferase [Halosimplex rubrum]